MEKKRFAGLVTVLIAMVLMVVSGKSAYAFSGEELTFSNESGYYASAFDLTISGDGYEKILYTLDGSEPSEGDSSTKVYSSAIRVSNLKGKTPVLATLANASNFAEYGAYNPSTRDLDRAFIVRAAGVKADGTYSKISTRSYFVGNNYKTAYPNCAVMSIVTDPDNLLDGDSGIYVLGNKFQSDPNGDFESTVNFMQSGKKWERAAYAEFFDGEDTALFSKGVGIRIHGGYSRRNQQKSFNIYFRKDYDYGDKNLKGYELIPDAFKLYDDKTSTSVKEPLTKYSNVMLRNGGNDVDYTKFQDAFIQSMVTDKHFGTQGQRPCVLYLNGEYWGLYNLTEKYSDKNIEEKYGVNKDNVIVYKELEIDEGEALDPDGAALKELLALGDLDMTKEENYNKFLSMVDEESFIDYYATEVYINNNDWWSGCNAETPNNNIMFWKVADPAKEINADGSVNPYADGKWRYMLYDTEWSMGIYNSTQAGAEYDSIKYHALGEPDPDYDTDYGRTEANGSPVFRAVFKNKGFRQKFFSALLDIRNYNFNSRRGSEALDRYSKIYTKLMSSNKVRWNSGSVSSRTNDMKNFLSKRESYSLKMIENNSSSELKSTDRVNVSINSNAAKKLTVNTVNPEVSPYWFLGVYYKQYPVNIVAPDVEGYTFEKWDVTGATVTENSKQDITVKFSAAQAKITAVYKDESGAIPTIEPSPSTTPEPTKNPNNPWGGWDWGWKTPTPAPTKEPSETEKPSAEPAPTPQATNVPDNQGEATVTQTPSGTDNTVNNVSQNTGTTVSDVKNVTVGTVFVKANIKYTVITAGEVCVSGVTNKKLKNAVIRDYVLYNGIRYKVTAVGNGAFKGYKSLKKISLGSNITTIGKKAFAGCKQLKNIIIKSKMIKKVNAGAFKSINKKAVIKVPSSSKKIYKKLFKGKGQGKAVKIK